MKQIHHNITIEAVFAVTEGERFETTQPVRIQIQDLTDESFLAIARQLREARDQLGGGSEQGPVQPK